MREEATDGSLGDALTIMGRAEPPPDDDISPRPNPLPGGEGANVLRECLRTARKDADLAKDPYPVEF
jgi:hypothetical protein